VKSSVAAALHTAHPLARPNPLHKARALKQ
jgi:hypothetical protein